VGFRAPGQKDDPGGLNLVMFLRTLSAFLILPGLAAGVLPPLLAMVDPWRGDVFLPGGAPAGAGLVVLLWCVRDFYVAGKGTLAPWDPPRHLVKIGLYRYVRNPMYVGVLLLVAGWAELLMSRLLLLYVLTLAIGFHLRVVFYEEPWLASRFGEDWQRYRAAVRRWWPRRSPWRDSRDHDSE